MRTKAVTCAPAPWVDTWKLPGTLRKEKSQVRKDCHTALLPQDLYYASHVLRVTPCWYQSIQIIVISLSYKSFMFWGYLLESNRVYHTLFMLNLQEKTHPSETQVSQYHCMYVGIVFTKALHWWMSKNICCRKTWINCTQCDASSVCKYKQVYCACTSVIHFFSVGILLKTNLMPVDKYYNNLQPWPTRYLCLIYGE